MQCIPKYWVSYKNQFHKAGEAFEIDPSDAGEMQHHGELIDTAEQQVETPAVKRGGRPKKNP